MKTVPHTVFGMFQYMGDQGLLMRQGYPVTPIYTCLENPSNQGAPVLGILNSPGIPFVYRFLNTNRMRADCRMGKVRPQ